MPDIDIDFDDDGRGKVIDYVKKYGSNQVAQIVTYGKMAAKSSIRDTARVLDLSLSDADYLAKLVPNMTKLSDIFESDKKKLSSTMRSDDYSNAIELKNIADGDNLQSETINQARVLEGESEKCWCTCMWSNYYTRRNNKICPSCNCKRFRFSGNTVR